MPSACILWSFHMFFSYYNSGKAVVPIGQEAAKFHMNNSDLFSSKIKSHNNGQMRYTLTSLDSMSACCWGRRWAFWNVDVTLDSFIHAPKISVCMANMRGGNILTFVLITMERRVAGCRGDNPPAELCTQVRHEAHSCRGHQQTWGHIWVS